jgi:signal transduction histidine kinase
LGWPARIAADRARSGRGAEVDEQGTKIAEGRPPSFRLRTWLLWGLGLVAVALLIGKQHIDAGAEEAERNARYATLLAHDVWNLDAENAARTVRVIADAEQYETVSVVLADGEPFVVYPVQAAERPEKASPPRFDTTTNIEREGELLATLHTGGSHGRLAYYALQVVVLLLGGVLAQLALKIASNKRNLERLRLQNEITLREEVEARLRQREGELRRAQRLEALGQVAGGVAHDFNNLLTVIIGRLEVARREADEGVVKHLEAALEAADRAHAMTDRLLAFGRGPESNPREVDLNELVLGMRDMLRHLLPEPVKLKTELHEGLPGVMADQGQLEQVVLNLVVNSRDAMPEGGVVQISTGLRENGRGEPQVTLTVKDTGVGMSEEVQSRVFEPFFTTKLGGEGTGLGLSTVARIVEQNHGKLELVSASGAGTTMTVVFAASLPLPERASRPPSGRASQPAPGPELPRPARVLVVEDDAGVRLFVREALEGVGVEVTTARDPKDALRILRLSPGTVDLVLSDVVMPNMSGLALRERARSSHVNVPFVFMSGQLPPETRRELETVLEKPFTVADLRHAVLSGLDARPSLAAQRST